jgi:hypothetical protein
MGVVSHCVLAATAVGATLELPVRFDLKPAAAGYAAGYVGVDASGTFDPGVGYGFDSAPIDARYGEIVADDVVARDDEARPLLRGCVRVGSGTRFRMKLAPLAKVRVRVILGAVPFWYGLGTTHYTGEATRIDDLDVAATKGAAGLAPVASGIDLRTAHKKGSLATDVGSYRKLWFTATATADGTLDVRFLGPAGAKIPVAAIEVYPFVPAPLAYARSGGTWLQPAAGSSVPGLDAFHARDYAAAKEAFVAIEDRLMRGYALAFLAGWLDGSDGDHAAATALLAKDAIDHPSLAAHPRAIELADRIADFLRAEHHYFLRGYAEAHALPPEGEGWFNTAGGAVLAVPAGQEAAEKHFYLAENLYAQQGGTSLAPIAALNAGTPTDPGFEPSPFVFRALERIATIHLGLNATHGYLQGGVPQADKLEPLELAEELLRRFESDGFLAAEFAGNADLAAKAHAARPEVHQHEQNGGLFEKWNGEPIDAPTFTSATKWWQDAIETAPAPGAPPWAIAQRDYLRAFRAAARFWVEQRGSLGAPGEFGGGEGDDPELLGLLVLPFAAIERHQDADIRAALIDGVRHALESKWIGDGYYGGVPTDVEHTAEFTTYPLAVGLGLEPTNPLLLQRSLDVARHLAVPNGDAVPWSVATQDGVRRFSSFAFNDQGPADTTLPEFAGHDVDVPLNARALAPAAGFLGATPNPTLRDHLLAWLEGWRREALANHASKPLGLVPAAVRSSDGSYGAGGPGAHWWKSGAAEGYYDYPANLQAIGQLYGGFFLLAYEVDVAERHRWLLPMLRLMKAVFAQEAAIAAGSPPAGLGVEGSTAWALAQLSTSSWFWSAAARSRSLLASDDYLRTTDDPAVPGAAPYVDDAFLAAYDAALATHPSGPAAHLVIPQGPIDVAGGTYGRKGKTTLVSQLRRGALWLAEYFPYATNSVLYTDRAFLFSQGSHDALYATLTGGDFGFSAATHVVNFAAREGEPDPDLAVLVNDLATGSDGTAPRLRVLLYNFGVEAATFDFALWHRLPFGRYARREGEALSTTDWFKSGVYDASELEFTERGQRFPITLPPGQVRLLELEHVADLAPSMAGAIALAAAGAPLAIEESTKKELRFAALATNIGDAPVTGATVEVAIELLGPDGSPVLIKGKSVGATTTAPASGSLAAVDGYDLPSVELSRSIPLTKPLLLLLGYGCSLRVTFAAPSSSAGFEVRGDDLLALDPTLTLGKPPKQAKKLKQAIAKQAKKLKL